MIVLPLRALRKRSKVTDVLLRIPLSGLGNLLLARGANEKRFWIGVLILAAGATVYYIVPLICLFARGNTIVDSNIDHSADLPFPFVYVCVIGPANKTYFESLLNVKKAIQELMKTEKGVTYRRFLKGNTSCVDDFVNDFMAFVASSPTDAPVFQSNFVPAFNELLGKLIEKSGDQWPGYKAFYEEGMFPCEKIVRGCTYNGVTFPCCRENMTANFENNICYGLTPSSTVSHDISQNISGWSAGMKFETSIDMEHVFDHLKESTGLRIHIGRELSLLDSPATVPVDTVGFIRLKARRRRLLKDCISQYKYDGHNEYMHPLLIDYKRSMAEPGQYGPKKCVMITILEALYETCGCLVHHDRNIKPNDSIICTPNHMYTCIYGGTIGDVKFDDGKGVRTDVYKSIKRRVAKLCLPYCDSWQYDTESTFVALPKDADGDSLLRNKFLINFPSLEYRQETDVLKLGLHEFISGIGSNLGLILGLSVIGIIQLAFWSLRAGFVKKRQRRAGIIEPDTQ